MRWMLTFIIFITLLSADNIYIDILKQNAITAQNIESFSKNAANFTPQKRACATCDWSISYLIDYNMNGDFLLQNGVLDSRALDSKILDSNSLNSKNAAELYKLKNTQNILQDSAISELFDDGTAEISDDYEFLGQRGQNALFDMPTNRNDIFANPLNSTNSLANKNLENIKVAKAVFMKKNIHEAYSEFLKHKNVFTCMYCAEMDRISPTLPPANKTIKYQNVTYSFTPANNMYKIETSDETCGIVDTFLFMQDSKGVELWTHTRFGCNNDSKAKNISRR